MKKTTKNIATLGVCIALSMILSYVDSQIMLIPSLPGIKLGLANAVTLYLLYAAGAGKSAAVTLLRVALSGLLFYGNVYHIAFGMSGAILAFAAMMIFKKTGKFGIVGVSTAGGVFHNIGQIIAVAVLTSTAELIYYLPVLLIGGSLCGVLVGIAGGIVIKRVRLTKNRT